MREEYTMGYGIRVTGKRAEVALFFEVPATSWDRWKSRLPKFFQRFLRPQYKKVDFLEMIRERFFERGGQR